MKFGLHFGSRGVAGDPDSLKAVALKAEALGYEHFGMSDHVIVATEVESAYPYSKSGKFFAQDTGISLEQVTALSFVAASTSRIRLLTSVLVLPHRHPLLAAKMLATVDVLSKGRLTVGVGVGWMAEEIALLGGPPFAERAQASDEYIAAFRDYGLTTNRSSAGRTRLSISCYSLRRRGRSRTRPSGSGRGEGRAQACGSLRQRLVPPRHQSSLPPRHTGTLRRRA